MTMFVVNTLTASEKRVLDMAKEMGTPFTPTEIGMKLGYQQARASSRVAPQLKSLTAYGLLDKEGTGKSTTYQINLFGVAR